MSLHDDMCPMICWYCSSEVGMHWQICEKIDSIGDGSGFNQRRGNCEFLLVGGLHLWRMGGFSQADSFLVTVAKARWWWWWWWYLLRTLQIPWQYSWILDLRYQYLPQGMNWIHLLCWFLAALWFCSISLGIEKTMFALVVVAPDIRISLSLVSG